MTENIVSKSEFARLLNKKPSYVTYLGKLGRLVYDESGNKIVVDASLKLMAESADLSKAGVVERHEKARAEKAAKIEPENDDDVEPIGTLDNTTDIVEGSYHDYKTRNEKLKSEKLEIELNQIKGELLITADVLKVIANSDAIVRQRIESLPDILAPQLAAENDELRIKSLLVDYIENVLTELSQSLRKMVKVS